MLLPIEIPHLMEEELEEGEILECPLLPTPKVKLPHFKHEQKSKGDKHDQSPKSSSHKKTHHVCKNHEKLRKENVKSNEKDPVRVVKYKVKPRCYRTHKNSNDEETSDRSHKSSISSTKSVRVNKKPYTPPRTVRTVNRNNYTYRNYGRHSISKFDVQENSDTSFEDLLDQYKTLQSKLAHLRREFNDEKTPNVSELKKHSKRKHKTSVSKSPPNKIKKLSEKVENKDSILKSPSVVEIEKREESPEIIIIDEEGEDEDDLEFLRSQALASCAKLPSTLQTEIADEFQENDIVEIVPLADNYEIVDMEVSDDEFTMEKDNALITLGIDNPQYSEHLTSPVEVNNDEDSLDDDVILRAQLLLEMNEKRYTAPEHLDQDAESPISNNSCQDVTPPQIENNLNEFDPISPSNSNDDDEIYFVTSTDPNKSKEILNESFEKNKSKTEFIDREILIDQIQTEVHNASNTAIASNFELFALENKLPHDSRDVIISNKVLSNPVFIEDLNDKENIVQRDILESENSSFQQNISITCKSDSSSARKVLLTKPKLLPFIPQEPVKPLIIQFDKDSSESDDEEDVENKTVASIEKLIEDAKSKSRQPETLPQGSAELVSNISVTDKVEVAKLIRLMEPKDALKPSPQQVLQMRLTHNSLLSKLFSARSNFQKDQQLFNMVKLQANRKKSDFIASQIEVNRIKLQLKEAEVRRAGIQKAMYEANTRLATVEKTINMSKTVIDALQKECLKRGKQLFGEKYILPKVYTNSPFTFRRKFL